jgi:hypothetical protein
MTKAKAKFMAAEKNGVVLRKKEECKWDLVSLGEVMLRLDPGDVRVATTRQFTVWEGGGEYNVARGLRRCFGLKTAVVTALADNPVGRLVEDMMLQGGVDQSHVKWVKYDGVGRTVRNGRCAGLLRPRQHGSQPAQARRHRLGRDLRQRRCAVVSYRRHLLRAERDDSGGLQGGDARGAQAWHDDQL